MKLYQISGDCSHSWNKKQLVDLGNFRNTRAQPQGYYTLFVDNSVHVVDEMPIFNLRELNFN